MGLSLVVRSFAIDLYYWIGIGLAYANLFLFLHLFTLSHNFNSRGASCVLSFSGGFLSFFSFLSISFLLTDEDTAEYLFDVLSSKEDRSSWLAQGRRVTVVAIQDALRGLRGAKVYEERVAEALATLS